MAKYTSAPQLGRSRPADAIKYTTAAVHSQEFYTEFQGVDMWDEDGWLITAVCNPSSKGIFTIARKGTQVREDYMSPTAILYYSGALRSERNQND